MAILTLTTDYGPSDYYQAALKGGILRHSPQLNIIDVSQVVNPFDIQHAAYLLKNAYRSFPQGTIHLVTVNTSEKDNQDLILIEEVGQYFIGYNNGLFSLVFESRTGRAIKLKKESAGRFIFKNFIGRLVRDILDKKDLPTFGELMPSIKEVFTLQPVITQKEIRGSIVRIDHFGNAVTNVHITLFESLFAENNFIIFFRRTDQITSISNSVSEVPLGELFASFNEVGFLYIGINMGNAAELLTLRKDDILQIEMYSK